MNVTEYLNKNIKVTIDRKMGSKHPKHEFIYPVNYGFVPNTISGDGEELDCYVLGVFEPLDEFEGKCIAIIHRLNDNDDKLIIAPDSKNFSNNEIEVLTEFQERFFEHEIIRSDIVFNSLIPELSVSNIESSKKFYENLGFKIIYERPESKFCFMQLENNQIMLEENNGNWNVGQLEYPYGNGINISMSIKDIKKKYNEIVFVTHNTGKIKSAEKYFKNLKFTTFNYELDEPRSDDIKEIAKSKVTQAYEMVNRPCIALDTDFRIDELNGFPRAFVNFSLDTIGIDGILKLMENKDNRSCAFNECLAYHDGNEIHYFYGKHPGNLSYKIQGLDRKEKWSDLWYIFKPKGFEKTLAEMNDDERENRRTIDGSYSALEKFAEWYEKNN